MGCSAVRLADTPARSTSRARLHSAAFQPCHGSEPRVQFQKVLQHVCCERFGCQILPCCRVQMLPFAAPSEPVEILVEAVQQNMSQLVMVNFTELLKNAPEVGKTKKQPTNNRLPFLSGYSDSNGGPSAPKADTLTNCATPRIIP